MEHNKKPARPGWGMPIRFKIIGLIAAGLTLSILSYLYVGTSLIVKDKISYIYDYNLNRIKSVGEQVEARVNQGVNLARLMGASLDLDDVNHDRTVVKQIYNKEVKSLGVPGLLILRQQAPIPVVSTPTVSVAPPGLPVTGKTAATARFEVKLELGPEAAQAKLALEKLGWTPEVLKKQDIIVGNSLDGRVPIGGSTVDSKGNPLAFVFLFDTTSIQLDQGKDIQLYLMDTSGKLLRTTASTSDQAGHQEIETFAQGFLKGTFQSGATDWTHGNEQFIVGYQRMVFNRLLAVGVISKTQAFAAAKDLAQRALAMGIGILSLSIGLALVFARRLTGRLRQMFEATQRVAKGDFSTRVVVGQAAKDEVSGLASSFNAMADKIDDLMKETAIKARMEKELETAQAVQGYFFPMNPLVTSRMNFAGKYIPASECAGDWWHYSQSGDEVLVVIGDVTGHGASSALVTAAVHGAFTTVIGSEAKRTQSLPSLETLMESLNRAVLAAARGEVTMTLLASIINVKTGLMRTANASHCLPYIYRAKDSANPHAGSQFNPVLQNPSDALGLALDTVFAVHEDQLLEGDAIVWYTDGVFDCLGEDGRKLRKMNILSELGAMIQSKPNDALSIREGFLEAHFKAIGKSPECRPDDISLVIGVFPVASSMHANQAA